MHLDSRGTYGARRVHAKLVLGHGLLVGRCAVEDKVYCAVVVGWSIDASPTAALVTNAPDIGHRAAGSRRDRHPLRQ